MRNLWLSISSTDFYQSLWAQPLTFGLKFFFLWMAVIGVVSSSLFAFGYLPELKFDILASLQQMPEHFPEGTQVFLSNGSLYTDPELLIIPLPDSWLSEGSISSEQTPELLAVLTREDLSPNEWAEDSGISSILFADNSGLYVNQFSADQSGWAEFPFSALAPESSLLINHENAASVADSLADQVNKYFPSIQIITLLLLTVLLIITRLTIVLFESSFLFIFLRLYGKKATFLRVLGFCLVLIVPAEFINQLSLHIWPSIPVSMLNISFWLMAVFILFTTRDSIPQDTARA